MSEAIPGYEIRLHRSDGTLSLVMMTAAISDADAKRQAELMLKEGLMIAHIWRDQTLVETISLLPGERADQAA